MEAVEDRVKARSVRLSDSVYTESAARAGRRRISTSLYVEEALREKHEREDKAAERAEARRSA